MSGGKVFVDTNVIVYALDADNPEKRSASDALIERLGSQGRLVFSTQVFQEAYNAAVRKLGLPSKTAEKAITSLFGHPTVQVDLPLIQSAMHRHQRDGFSFYDSLIVEAALSGGCSALATEDLQHGRRFGKLRVVNPFQEQVD